MLELVSSTATNFAPLQSRWVPASDRFISVGSFKDGKGAITIKQVDQDLQCQTLKTIESSSGYRCATFGVSPTCLRRLTTGQYDGSVSIWDLQHSQSAVWSGKHSKLVNSVDVPPNAQRPEFISSSRDGTICLWDTRTPGNAVISIISEKQNLPDAWVTKFDPSNNDIIFGGYKNGNISAFDLRNSGMFWNHQLSDGICDLEVNTKGLDEGVAGSLLVVTPKGKFSLFKLQDLEGIHLPLVASMSSKTHPRTSSTIWCGSYCQSTNYFMLTTNDGYLSLHKQKHSATTEIHEQIYTEECAHLRVSDCGVLSFQWNTEKKGLFLFSCLDKTTSVGFASLNLK